jgi:hypothetical protein
MKIIVTLSKPRISRMAPSGSTNARTTGLVASASAFATLSKGCVTHRIKQLHMLEFDETSRK